MDFVKRISAKLKSEAVDLASAAGMLPLLIKEKRGARILMYHGVMPANAKRFNTRHIDLACFEEQITFVKKHCNVLSLEDFFLQKFSNDQFNICITFDDGYLNNYKYAFPVLKKYNVPASFFITGLNQIDCNILWADFLNIASTLTNESIVIDGKTFSKKSDGLYYHENESLIDCIKKSDFNFKLKMLESFEKKVQFRNQLELFDYWQLMTDNQIKEIADSGIVSIGSHAFYHNNLGKIPLEDAETELKKSKAYLESLTQKKVDALAYPDGSYTRAVVDMSEKLGFQYQLAADNYLFAADRNDKRIIDRHGIYPCASCNNLILEFFN